MAKSRFKSTRTNSTRDPKRAEKPAKWAQPLVALARLLGRTVADQTLVRKKGEKA